MALLAGLWSAAAAPAQTVADPAAAVAAVPGWTLSLDAEEAWESNVRFSAPEGPGDTVSRLAARLDRTWSGRRGRFALSGGGRGSLYREVSDLNRFTYTADAGGEYLLSPRAVVRASDAFLTGYASEIGALTGTGLLLPTVLSRVNNARGSFSYAASRRTTASLEVHDERVSFDDPALIGGSTLTGSAILSQEITRADTLSATVLYSLSSVEAERSRRQTGYAAWSHAFGTSVRGRARFGASRFQPLGVSAYRTTPVGGGDVEARWGRQTIEGRYDRFVDLAYGLGRVRVNNLFSGRYAVSLTSALVADVRAFRGRSVDPVDASFELTNTDLAAGLRYTLTGGIALVGSYTRRQSVQAPAAPVFNQGVSVFVTYERAWR